MLGVILFLSCAVLFSFIFTGIDYVFGEDVIQVREVYEDK